MAGKLVPIVVLPRYSTFTEGTFRTVPIDVSDYKRAILTVWRGNAESGTLVEFTCQESTDQVTWGPCAGTNASFYDPGADAEGVVIATLAKRWFRFHVYLYQVLDTKVTCWAAGHMEKREV